MDASAIGSRRFGAAFAAFAIATSPIGNTRTIQAANPPTRCPALLVVNKGDRTLSVVDPDGDRELAAIPVGGVTGHEVAVSPDGREAWVPIYGDAGVGQRGSDGRTVSIIDLARTQRVGSVNLGRASRPHFAAFGSDGLLYVTSELTRSVVIIDPRTRRVIGSIPTGQEQSHMLAIVPAGHRAFVANVSSGTLSILDLRARRLIKVVRVAKTIQRVAISPDGRHVVTADQDAPLLHVVDAITGRRLPAIRLPGKAYSIATVGNGRLVLTLPWNRQVAILDPVSRHIAHLVDVPDQPQAILVRPDRRVAYISTDPADLILAIDLVTGAIKQRLRAHRGSDGMAWMACRQASAARPNLGKSL